MEMVKKFGYSFIVVGALMFGFGVVNTAFIGSAKATEQPKEEKCEKCGHLPSKPEGDCRCDCHHRHK